MDRSTIYIKSREIEELSVFHICHTFCVSYRQALLSFTFPGTANLPRPSSLQLGIEISGKNNGSAGLNGNAIESEATRKYARKSRIQDGVRCNGRDTVMQIGRIFTHFQGRYIWRGNVKVYFLLIEEEYEGMLIYILHILRSKMYQLSQFN